MPQVDPRIEAVGHGETCQRLGLRLELGSLANRRRAGLKELRPASGFVSVEGKVQEAGATFVVVVLPPMRERFGRPPA